jgi:hypothetical protein
MKLTYSFKYLTIKTLKRIKMFNIVVHFPYQITPCTVWSPGICLPAVSQGDKSSHLVIVIIAPVFQITTFYFFQKDAIKAKTYSCTLSLCIFQHINNDNLVFK